MGGATETLDSDSTTRMWWSSLEKGCINCFAGVNSIPQVNDCEVNMACNNSATIGSNQMLSNGISGKVGYSVNVPIA